MSINSIGFFGNCGNSKSRLSEELRQKLLALGVDPSSVSSDAEAIALIEAILQTQITTEVKSTKSENFCCGEQELIARARKLASRINLTVSDNLTLEEILEKISKKLNEKIQEFSQDEKVTSLLKSCQDELNSIQNDYSIVKQNEKAMFASMNFNASMNKMMLGL